MRSLRYLPLLIGLAILASCQGEVAFASDRSPCMAYHLSACDGGLVRV